MLAAASAVVAVTLASACAAVPDGGIVTSARIAQRGGQQPVVVQMIPSGPQQGWGPGTIVEGFLLASTNFTNNHAIAREYLTPAAAKSWRPGSSVIEFADMPTTSTDSVQANTVTVGVSGNVLGTISEDGQYQAAEPGMSQGPFDFTVVNVKGQWRIVDPPDQLLFPKTEVSRTFRPRDLYFFDPSLTVLVPDPVYVPAAATSQQLVTHLVLALQQGRQGWLAKGTRTAFLPGTSLLGTSVTGNTATINLGGRVAAAGAQERDEIAKQLLETLTTAPAYPQPDAAAVESVVFEINGKPVQLSCTTGQPPALQNNSSCSGPVPTTPGSRAYYIDSKGRVATLFGPQPNSLAPGPAGTGQSPFDMIAVSPDQLNVAGVSGGVLYTGGLTQNGSLSRQLAATDITALSWDTSDDLWIAGKVGQRAHIWWLGRGARPVPVVVGVPDNVGPVTALRVAPDGVRVAMVTGSGAGARLWLAAIERSGNQVSIGKVGRAVPIGTDVPGQFTDLTWYDTGDVIVLTQPPTGPQLYEVPVDGGPSRPIATESGTVSITASSDASGGSQLVAARIDRTLIQLPDPSGSIWRPVTSSASSGTLHGTSPVYPG